MVCDEVEPINCPSVLEIPCIVINGQHLDTRTQLAENLKLIEVNLVKGTFSIYVLNYFTLSYFSAQNLNSSKC